MNKRFAHHNTLFTFIFLMGITPVIGKTAQQWHDELNALAKKVVDYAKNEGNKLHYIHPFSKFQEKEEILTDNDVEALKKHQDKETGNAETPPLQPLKPADDLLEEEDRPQTEINLVNAINVFTEGSDFNRFIANQTNQKALLDIITAAPGYDFDANVDRSSYTLTDADLTNFVKIYLTTRKYPYQPYYFQPDEPTISPRCNKMAFIKHDQSVGARVITLLNLSRIQSLIGTPCKDKTAQANKPITSYGLRDFVILAAKKLQDAHPLKRTFNKAEQARLQAIMQQFKEIFAYRKSQLLSSFMQFNETLERHKLLQEEAFAIALRDYYLGGTNVKTSAFNLLIKYFTKTVTPKQQGKKPTEAYLQALVEYEIISTVFPEEIVQINPPEEKSRLHFTQNYKQDLTNDKKQGIPLELQVSRLMKIKPLRTRIERELSSYPLLTAAGITSALTLTALMVYANKRGRASKLGTLGWLYYKIKSTTTGLSAKDLQFYARTVSPIKIFDIFTQTEALKISQIQEAMLEKRNMAKKYGLTKETP